MEGNGEYKLEHVVWVLTTNCNLNCMHCRYSGSEADSNQLTTEESLKLCKELAELNVNDLSFTGGEPLTRSDWEIIAKELIDAGIKLNIISNGLLINEDIVSKLKDLNVNSVALSLDGASADTHDHIRGVNGSFSQVLRAIDLLKDANIVTSIVTTVSKLNFEELPKIKEILQDKNIIWQVLPAFMESKSKEQNFVLSDEEYYSLGLYIMHASKDMHVLAAHNMGYHSDQLTNLPVYPVWDCCQAGISLIGILSNGDITGCCSLPNNITEGNVREHSLKEIWNDPNSFEYNRKFTKENLGENCRDCQYGESCKGGCCVISNFSTGKFHNDPYCFHRLEKQKKML